MEPKDKKSPPREDPQKHVDDPEGYEGRPERHPQERDVER
jgi:hypothetical protein